MNLYFRTFYFLILTTALLSLNACEDKDKPKIVTLVDENNGHVDSLPLAAIGFDSNEFNFGVIKDGEIVQHTFKFTNTGKAPLIVNNAKASCGCTVPQWTKEAIAPGGTGKIDVTFNSSGKGGQKVEKRVTVYANTSPAETLLFIKGEVLSNSVKK
ncbi:MAG TPA: DUF1573 domain-containing protein [Cytophagaceae bacterium]|jgi:hypothetical protein|nr:DUF1573 domain-containing protein [Cytophagaceae bacterium]